jgi:hypothetical protein
VEEYLSQLLNVHRLSDVIQIEIHTAEPLIPDLGHSGVKSAIAKLKTYCDMSTYCWVAQLVSRRWPVNRTSAQTR